MTDTDPTGSADRSVPTDSLGNPITVPDSDDILVVSAADGSRWELVCGLEVHAELATRTKMFSGAPNRFGDEPNTNIDPVTLGLPGTLPVVNERAVELAATFGCAVGATVQRSVFSRKNYFYPDMPKDFQISQYDQPIVIDGTLELPSGHVVGIERAHLEEDTGKSTHVGGDGRIHGADHSLVDYNRAGVPLLEIVSRPHVRSAEQARAYVSELRSILVACGISDGKMEEGSMRVDANVSVRPEGSDEIRTRCEIKNVNSLRSLGRAIEYEATRQADLHASGDRVVQETRHWNEADGRTSTMRSKEEADDYRYFPEPDLVPIDLGAERVAAIAATLPLLPAARRARLAEVTGEARTAESVVVVVERGQDDQALAALAWTTHLASESEGGPHAGEPDVAGRFMAEVVEPLAIAVAPAPKPNAPSPDSSAPAESSADPSAASAASVARWVLTDEGLAAAREASDAAKARVLVHVTQNLGAEGGADLSPLRLAELVAMEVAGELTATQAKQVLAELVDDPAATAGSVATAKGFEAMDTGALEAQVDAIIAANPSEWEQFRTGDPKVRGKLTGFFVGQVMKATKGQADGKQVTALLQSKAT
ncbi:MAG: gatB [Acidimicrobiales bacterium]|nr:gatB [Acidimicrobiales bacterium]